MLGTTLTDEGSRLNLTLHRFTNPRHDKSVYFLGGHGVVIYYISKCSIMKSDRNFQF